MPDDTVTPLRPPKPCPICRRQSVRAFHPFCSKRCADIDLNRWLSNAYVIPGGDNDSGEGSDAAPGQRGMDDDGDR